MNYNQVIVRLLLKIEDESAHISSLELNVIDNANIKLVREESNDAHESIKLGFSLNPSVRQHETECFFVVNDCTYAQMIKGNITYMIKNEESTSQEKLDFKLNMPCSSFLSTAAYGCSDLDEFAQLLSSGQLTAKRSIKLTPETVYADIKQLTRVLFSHFDLQEIEIIDNNASIFSSSIKSHPICLLIKLANDHSVTIDAKSTNSSLLENLLDEFKAVF